MLPEKMPEHMVSRARGAALNAGQVFARRCALHIAHQKSRDRPLERQQILSTINEAQQHLNQGLLRDDVRETIQNTMSHHAAILCHTQGINTAAQTRQHFVKIFAGKVFNAMKTAGTIFPVAAKCATGAGCTAFFTMLCRKRWWESWCRGYL